MRKKQDRFVWLWQRYMANKARLHEVQELMQLIGEEDVTALVAQLLEDESSLLLPEVDEVRKGALLQQIAAITGIQKKVAWAGAG